MPEQKNIPAPYCGQWQGKALFSLLFEEGYFSSQDGFGEAKYVFLAGNELPKRFAESTAIDFTIGELGFGTGLNFFAAYHLWQTSALRRENKEYLHFISCEKNPLPFSTMAHLGVLWPELEPFVTELSALWLAKEKDGVLAHGWHVFKLKYAVLYLYVGGVEDMFLDFPKRRCDAWFLDGFSPKKNPAMWCSTVLQNVAQNSHEATTLATFTAVGRVRRTLEKAGFNVHKIKGFGMKRHMTVAYGCGKLGKL